MRLKLILISVILILLGDPFVIAVKPSPAYYTCSVSTANGATSCDFLDINSIIPNAKDSTIFDVVDKIDIEIIGRGGVSYNELIVALVHNITNYQEVISIGFNRNPDKIFSDGYGNQYGVFYGVDDVEIRYQVSTHDPRRIVVTQGQDLLPLYEPYEGDHYFYAYEYTWGGEYWASLKVKQSWSAQKQTKDTWYDKGLDLANQGKYKEAIQAFERAIELDPENTTILRQKGKALANMGNLSVSIRIFENLIELDPNDAEAWYNKGNILYNLSMHSESIEAYKEAIEIDPEYKDAWIKNGQILCEIGKYDEALIAFDKAIELNPNDAEAWFNKGSVLDSLGRYDEAVKVYDKVIELKPSFAKAIFNRSKAKMQLASEK